MPEPREIAVLLTSIPPTVEFPAASLFSGNPNQTQGGFMRARTRLGVGKGEVLAFLVLFGAVAMFAMYLNQKPKVIERDIVIQSPPPPVVAAPVVAPPPPPAPVVKVAPPPPVIAPRIVVESAPPPPPECVVIEAKLRDAQGAVTMDQAQVAFAKSQAITKAEAQDDFTQGKAYADEKKAAAKAAVDKLRTDEDAMVETDDEKKAVRDTEADWLSAENNLAQIQADAVTSDPAMQQAMVKLHADTVLCTTLENSLSGYVQTDMANALRPSDCAIRAVAVDPSSGIVSVDLNHPAQAAPGAATDVEMSTIGDILTKSLRHSAYDWNSAIFTVYFTYQGNDAIEFQMTYPRPSVDASNFSVNVAAGGYVDDTQVANLASEFWISPIVGASNVSSPTQAAYSNSTADPQSGDSASTSELIGGVWYDVLVIGGYRRADGSYCPRIYIKHPHEKTGVKAGEIVATNDPPKPTASQTRTQAETQSGARVQPSPSHAEPTASRQAPPPKPTLPPPANPVKPG
jgi:hypothetical protein